MDPQSDLHFFSKFEINGDAMPLTNPDGIFQAIKDLMEKGQNIEVHVEGPLAAPLMPLMTVAKQIEKVILNLPPLPGMPHFPHPQPAPGAEAAPVPDRVFVIDDSILICMGIIAMSTVTLGLPLVAGTSAIMLALAAALVIAVSKGYDVDAQLCDKVGGSAGGEGSPGTNLDMCKKIVLTKRG